MKKLIAFVLLIYLTPALFSQENKKALTFDDILQWNRITQKIISNDGSFIVYKTEPWKGDPQINILTKTGKKLKTINCGASAEITADSKFVIVTINPGEEEIRQLKFKKTKKEDMPENKLGVYQLKNSVLDTISNLKSFQLPKKWNGWLAYQTKSEIIKDTTIKEANQKTKDESNDNGYPLKLRNLTTGETTQFPYVTDYIFAKEKQRIAFISTGDDKNFKPGVYFLDLESQQIIDILTIKGEYKQLSMNNNGNMIAFLADTSHAKKKDFGLYLWNNNGLVKELIHNGNKNLKDGWILSENREIQFAENTNRIFFGIAQIKPEKDTSKLDEDIPQLDIWHWNEPVLHSQQLNTMVKDQKKSYLAVYHLDENKFVQLEDESFSGIELIRKGNADKVFAWSNLPYAVQTMWEAEPEHNDFYLIDIHTGKSTMIKKDCRAYPELSPNGNYIYWYNYEDTSWNTYKISSNTEFKVTVPTKIQCANEINDVPNLPEPYGIAAWTINDESILVYDRYDIWQINPENKLQPINITLNGRKNKISYRLLDFENMNHKLLGDDETGIDPSKTIYLKGQHEITRNNAYYKTFLPVTQNPFVLFEGSYSLSNPIKAKDANVFIYTKETFELFPNLLLTENEFKKSKQISDVNPQQKDFLWGSKELYSWTSLDGQTLEGLLIKPANFDPTKKYPLIVNFYEKASHNLYSYQTPEAHRSTIDYHYYSGNGYVIFNPDVNYKEGYPGESAYNCVMPGITQLISEGYIDKDHIAAQGHSWGGYQVAYLATRTNLFAAIETGAPVVNMFSAYGGIRLWTGRNRSSQYEHTQSRIGKSIWESPLRYLENSPLFTADKIQTPMLIMHNEDDGAVPFSQGIEFFIALRRLGKQAWLLNYNEADHWPTKIRDKYDFQIRMAQFFDHFLKDKPMPVWMKEGIPAVNKELEMGYELTK